MADTRLQPQTEQWTSLEFPFTAVLGQPQFQLALTLLSVDPGIGGLLIRGPRGMAKSTLARALPQIQPIDAANFPFVTLPLNTTADMLTGSLDVQSALSERQLRFQPGLLARADGGALYVDEVNLLNDALVDLLLDVAASGVNCVEKDGLSESHSARFMLLGTMNPEEGELRPQLEDRFGLALDLVGQLSPQQRVEIVKRREAFEADPQAMHAEWAAAQQQLRGQITAARQGLPQVVCDDRQRLSIAEQCDRAGVDGMRADLVWVRTARTHAALQGRQQVTAADVDAVRELVLCHRRKAAMNQPPSAPNTSPGTSPGTSQNGQSSPPGGSRRPPQSRSHPHSQQRSQGSAAAEQAQGDWGAQSPQAPFAPEATIVPAAATQRQLRQQVTRARVDRHEIDWPRSLVAGGAREGGLCWRAVPQRQAALHVVLLDASASMLTERVLQHAAAFVQQLARRAYFWRDRLSVVAFAADGTQTLLPPQRAPGFEQAWWSQLSAGGGTPLRHGLAQAQRLLHQWQCRWPDHALNTWLLSDGRTRQSVNDLCLPGVIRWLDTEPGPTRYGQGQRLAREIKASYSPLSQWLGVGE